QVPKPAGLNMGAIIELILPITLSSLAYSTPKGILERNHMTMTADNITVLARFKKALTLFHMCKKIPLKVGNLYGGSSIIKDVSSSVNTFLPNSFVVSTAIKIPIKYRDIMTNTLCLGKNTFANNIYTGRRAPQDIKGFEIMVSILSL